MGRRRESVRKTHPEDLDRLVRNRYEEVRFPDWDLLQTYCMAVL